MNDDNYQFGFLNRRAQNVYAEHIHRDPPVTNKKRLYVNHDEVYVTKIAKIYKHNYISLKWLIHDGHLSCPAKELERLNLNFLEIAILKGILHVFNAKILKC